ncbi:MAG: GCN5 family acetyltransferase [Rhodospirillaceae bacterium]|nr:GCN5 family acetyltransferase [Rhodospirillaceae bacterium]|tara:strand:- start:1680 stop:2222 length:543 start_codon:yes stop_codon:yes gene_type:complete
MIIRRARIEDASAIAQVHVETWRSAYAGMLADEFLLNLSAKNHEARWWRHVLTGQTNSHCVYVADDVDAGVVGFCSGGRKRGNQTDCDAEIYALYVLDDFQGIGIGKSLFLELAKHLGNDGNESLLVWVLSQNPARFFYGSMGGKIIASRDGRVGGKRIHEFGYGWPKIETLSLPHAAGT